MLFLELALRAESLRCWSHVTINYSHPALPVRTLFTVLQNCRLSKDANTRMSEEHTVKDVIENIFLM